jgi:hypothetical protein
LETLAEACFNALTLAIKLQLGAARTVLQSRQLFEAAQERGVPFDEYVQLQAVRNGPGGGSDTGGAGCRWPVFIVTALEGGVDL